MLNISLNGVLNFITKKIFSFFIVLIFLIFLSHILPDFFFLENRGGFSGSDQKTQREKNQPRRASDEKAPPLVFLSVSSSGWETKKNKHPPKEPGTRMPVHVCACVRVASACPGCIGAACTKARATCQRAACCKSSRCFRAAPLRRSCRARAPTPFCFRLSDPADFLRVG